jgi:hypothetical protein
MGFDVAAEMNRFVAASQSLAGGFSKRTRRWRRVPVTGSAHKVIDSRQRYVS